MLYIVLFLLFFWFGSDVVHAVLNVAVFDLQGRGPLCICSQSEPEFTAEGHEEAGEE